MGKRIINLLIILLCSLEVVQAQDNIPQTIDLAYHKIDEIPDSYFQDFIQRLESNLAKDNIQLNILGNFYCCAPESSISVSFNQPVNPPILPYIYIYTDPRRDPLYAKFSLLALPNGFYSPPSSDEQTTIPQFFIDLATGISLYSINRCDIANKYFEKSQVSAATPQQKI